MILSTPPSDPSFLSTPSPVSPKEPLQTAATYHPASSLNTAYKLAIYWTAQKLTELKIELRNRRPDSAAVPLKGWPEAEANGEGTEAEGMGRNDATVRFIWETQA